MEVNFAVCGKFESYSVGVKIKCYYCEEYICLSYSAMEQIPKPFLCVCEKCRNPNKKTIYTAPSDFVMRDIYEKQIKIPE